VIEEGVCLFIFRSQLVSLLNSFNGSELILKILKQSLLPTLLFSACVLSFSTPVLAQLPADGQSACDADPSLPICDFLRDNTTRPSPSQNAPPTQNADDHTMVKLTQTGPAGSRDFYLYIPQALQTPTTHAAPLFVMLHGCTQSPMEFAAATGMNAQADARSFVVIYPEQTSQYNALGCWNWFATDNQARSGETELIAMMVTTAASKVNIDLNQVYLVGFSAGAAMASNLLACYGDIFAAGAIHSGLTYDAAEGETDGALAMQDGSTKNLDDVAKRAIKCDPLPRKTSRLIIFQGSQDSTVAPVNAQQIVTTFKKVDELASGTGSANNWKIAGRKIPSADHQFDAKVSDHYLNGDLKIESILIDNMDHAWSGGSSSQSYTQPSSLNATSAITGFFLDAKPAN